VHVIYITPKRICSFKFREVSDDISLTVQDRDVGVMEH